MIFFTFHQKPKKKLQTLLWDLNNFQYIYILYFSFSSLKIIDFNAINFSIKSKTFHTHCSPTRIFSPKVIKTLLCASSNYNFFPAELLYWYNYISLKNFNDAPLLRRDMAKLSSRASTDNLIFYTTAKDKVYSTYKSVICMWVRIGRWGVNYYVYQKTRRIYKCSHKR